MNHIKKLSLALAAMTLTGSIAGPASALSSADVTQIRTLVENGDDAQLRAFLLQNLGVLDDSPLSAMLRDYISSPPERTLLASLGFQNPMPAELQDIVARSKTDSSLY
jgi:hypothetical protein